MSYRILQGDVIERLRTLPEESVHCCVTSPPYWGLRDYGVEGQIGLEATPAEFLAKMVAVFREVRRVLRSDGTCWMNMGDSYATGTTSDRNATATGKHGYWENPAVNKRVDGRSIGLKAKDLIGMPSRLAFALQEDGWWLRQDIIWAKPNPMPESVTDRCTKAHEYVFLLTKSAKYFYDTEAIKETVTGGAHARGNGLNPKAEGTNSRFNVSRDAGHVTRPKQNSSYSAAVNGLVGSRNKRSVWSIATEAFPEAHFATFPTKLVEPCILAGTSEMGCCDVCGAPLVRLVDVAYENPGNRATTGWKPSCEHNADSTPCTVLDPFSGAATTGLVALRLGRGYVGVELNPEYVAMSERRLATWWKTPQRRASKPDAEHAPLFAQAGVGGV